jgi:cytochrome d ubiquinol oxidase subunit II
MSIFGAIDLTIIWAGIIAFAVAAYVVLDGFDLGIGILFPALKVGEERDTAMNTIAPVWDGNETWLVLGGGGLMAAFPLAYAIILPALYAPLIAMLLALVFRGVAFEFRWRDPRHRAAWDIAFFAGSITAAFAQGITLGALLQGIEVSGRAYAGGWWDWLTPFTLLTGISIVAGYALLGACWVIWKSEGSLQSQAFKYAKLAAIALIACIAAVSIATPFLETAYFERWFSFPNLILTAPVPLLLALTTFLFFKNLQNKAERAPFLLALAFFALSLVGLAISMWPYVIPESVTIWQAAAPANSQSFMLVGALIMVPIILIYTGWSYWVFRGKVAEGGYH